MLRADITVAEFGASPRRKQSGEESGFVQWLRANVLWVLPFTLVVFLFVACIVTITVYAVLTAPPAPPSPPPSPLPSPPPAAASPPPPPPDGHCDTLTGRENCDGAGAGTDQTDCELLGCCWHTDAWDETGATHDLIACFKRVVSGSVFPPPPSPPAPSPPPPSPSPPPPWPPRTSVTAGCHTIADDPCQCCSSVDGRTGTGFEWVQNAPLCRPAQTGQSFGDYSNTCEVEQWLNTNPTELAKADDCSTISGC